MSTALTHASSVMPLALLYASTKGAVEQLVRVLSHDLGARGITVNAIAPGAVDTPLFRAGKPPHLIKWIASLNPQKRIPLPDEISPMVAFLACEEAEWVNGQIIGVNGVSHASFQAHAARADDTPALGVRGVKLGQLWPKPRCRDG